jgi:hypothetical protein
LLKEQQPVYNNYQDEVLKSKGPIDIVSLGGGAGAGT